MVRLRRRSLLQNNRPPMLNVGTTHTHSTRRSNLPILTPLNRKRTSNIQRLTRHHLRMNKIRHQHNPITIVNHLMTNRRPQHRINHSPITIRPLRLRPRNHNLLPLLSSTRTTILNRQNSRHLRNHLTTVIPSRRITLNKSRTHHPNHTLIQTNRMNSLSQNHTNTRHHLTRHNRRHNPGPILIHTQTSRGTKTKIQSRQRLSLGLKVMQPNHTPIHRKRARVRTRLTRQANLRVNKRNPSSHPNHIARRRIIQVRPNHERNRPTIFGSTRITVLRRQVINNTTNVPIQNHSTQRNPIANSHRTVGLRNIGRRNRSPCGRAQRTPILPPTT